MPYSLAIKNNYAYLAILSLLTVLILLPSQVMAQPDLPDGYTPPRSSIDLSELEGNLHGFSILGEVAGDQVGKAVDTGDINGDGYIDIIIGAHNADPNGTSSGKTYVYFGKSSGSSSSVELSGLNGSTGFSLSGEASGDYSGYAVSSGDINGDGFDDVIIGAYKADPNGTSSGKTYVYFGKSSGFSSSVELSGLNGSTGFSLSGEASDGYSGYAVSSGDINGDGYGDVIIGAHGVEPNGIRSGKTYVYFGKSSGFSSSVELSGLNGSTGFSLSGEASGDDSGGAVGSGDMNGDGYDDVIIGASGADPNGTSSGKTYVYFGKSSGFSSSVELSGLNGSTGFSLSGEASGDYSGYAVSSGDINGDGFDDVIIGAPDADPNASSSGKTYVYFGKKSSFSSSVKLYGLDGSSGFSLNGEGHYDKSGIAISSGDINRDGYGDVIIGAYRSAPNGTSSGKTYVYFGKKSSFSSSVELSRLNGISGFSLNGNASYDYSGVGVGSGDINGDEYDDVIIGAYKADPNGSSSGKTYIFNNTAEQTISGDEGFRMLGSIAGGKVFDELLSPFWTQGFSYSDAPPFGPNAWTWDAEIQSWKALTDQRNNTLDAGSGFLFYMFSDDHNNGTSTGFPKTITSPASLISVNDYDFLVNTDIVYPFTDLPADDFFLVSNPYASEIDWDAASGWTKTNLSNTIYIWSDADNAWLTWNGSSGTLPDNGIIAPFQSFFVQATGGPGSLTIEKDVKTSTSGTLIKTNSQEQDKAHSLELVAETEEAKSKTYLNFHPEGTIGRDAYDGLILNPLSNKYLQLGMENSQNKEIYSIFSLPRDHDSDLIIPLHLTGMNISSDAGFYVRIPEEAEHKWEFILRDTQSGNDITLTNEQKAKVSIDVLDSHQASFRSPSNSLTLDWREKDSGARYELIMKSVVSTANDVPKNDLPKNVQLQQNYPNPFNPSTFIAYQIPVTGFVKLEVFDLMGRRVAELVDKKVQAGYHQVNFNAKNLASGTYIYQLRTKETVITKKLTLIK